MWNEGSEGHSLHANHHGEWVAMVDPPTLSDEEWESCSEDARLTRDKEEKTYHATFLRSPLTSAHMMQALTDAENLLNPISID